MVTVPDQQTTKGRNAEAWSSSGDRRAVNVAGVVMTVTPILGVPRSTIFLVPELVPRRRVVPTAETRPVIVPRPTHLLTSSGFPNKSLIFTSFLPSSRSTSSPFAVRPFLRSTAKGRRKEVRLSQPRTAKVAAKSRLGRAPTLPRSAGSAKSSPRAVSMKVASRPIYLAVLVQ